MVFSIPIYLAKIALSCQFALDLLCCKEGAFDSASCFIGLHCPWSFFKFVAPLPSWQHSDSFMNIAFVKNF